ncbi:5-hydroxytryptamine receptor 3A-like [Brachionichthys hirsutus]|uniref:5-hydroxytryptamine receptor 3A-like n=1 Tax=Brachionichthys hirsutus TaxID=412623 RepID=UPI003604C459
MLIKKDSLSQPQDENCTHVINVPFLEYQTLSVDTKKLLLNVRMQASLVWSDPDMAWNRSEYQYDEAMLPVMKVWTPELHVTNGIKTTMKHASRDLLAYYDGTIKHTVIINAEVNCEVDMFNYPFAADDCPVALQAWTTDGERSNPLNTMIIHDMILTVHRECSFLSECGTQLTLGQLWMIDGAHGDWQTENVQYLQSEDRTDRNYILVSLRIRYINPFITLLLPSILILLADVISFALPLAGGERNCFKVTLVLSFTMFLVILNNELPGDSHCSPIIRTHFCVCLSLLVLSMLVSMMLTGLAHDGKFLFCWCTTGIKKQKNRENNEEQEVEEVKPDISVIQLHPSDENNQLLRKVVSFLDDHETQKKETQIDHNLANKLDKIFFFLYFIFGTVYFAAMLYVMVNHNCVVNHFNFWY